MTQDSIWNWYNLGDYGTYSEENDDYFVPLNMAVGFLKEVSDEGQHWCAYVDAGYYTDCDTAPSHWKSLPNNPIRHT